MAPSQNYCIREIRPNEIPLLEDFLYEAIFIPEGTNPPPKSIIKSEELQIYIRDFGMFSDDKCLVAETDGKIVGAVWSRIMNDYGHVGDGIPSLAISLYKEFRNKGIGTELLRQMLQLLRHEGYANVSLSVQKEKLCNKYVCKGRFCRSERNRRRIHYGLRVRIKTTVSNYSPQKCVE